MQNNLHQPVTTKFIDLDFETRSKIDLMSCGAHKYAKDKSTGILIFAWTINGNKKAVESYDILNDGQRKIRRFTRLVKRLTAKGYKIRAFNAMFEYLIWNHVGVKQLGFPKLDITNFYCVQAEACIVGLPAALEHAAMVAGEESKNTDGKAFINMFCNPQTNGEFVSPRDKPDEFNKGVKYCKDDVIAQIAVADTLPTMTNYQYRTYILTEQMNIRGLPIDKKMVAGALSLADDAKKESDAIIQRLTDGEIDSVTQNKKLQIWLQANGCKIPNMQAPTILRWIKERKGKIPDKCYDVLLLRKNGAKSSVAKFAKAQDYLTDENKVHDFIKYHIASTGRWGGRGLQVQNFSKPAVDFPKWADMDLICEMIGEQESKHLALIYNSLSEALKAVTRGMICAPEGFKLVAADYSQVEARIVMWLANDKTGLLDFSGEGKVYENMAADIFDTHASRIAKPSKERDIGKETVLGCGFGMGANKFFETCTVKRGLNIEIALSEKAVKAYRARYAKVPKAWRDCEKKAILATDNPGERYFACDGKTSYYHDGTHLTATLPSGRMLYYPFAIVKTVQEKYGPVKKLFFYHWDKYLAGKNKWTITDIWGGTLFQHKVQAIAADAITEGMLNAEAHNYSTLFTVHDEAISLVPDNKKYSYKKYEQILCKMPSWANGIPLVAEGWEGRRYRK